MFRNLTIRSKLLALLAVPVAGAVLLGVTGVTAALHDRARAGEERRAAAVAGQAVAAIHELQEERVRAAVFLAGDDQDGQAALRDRRRRVDGALAAYRAAAAGLGRTGDQALDQAMAVATERLDRLAVVRVEVDRRLVTVQRTMAGHDAMVNALLGVTRGLASQLEAPELARTARLLLALTAAKEATGQERVVVAAPPASSPATASTPAAGPATARTPAAGPAKARAPGVTKAADGDLALAVRLAATAAVARQELNGLRAAAGTRLQAVDRALGVPGAAPPGGWSWPCSTRSPARRRPAT